MFKGRFKKPENVLEASGKHDIRNVKQVSPSVPDEMFTACPKCKFAMYINDMDDNNFVCDKCGYHFKLSARKRIKMICDEASFTELFSDYEPSNIISFPGYDRKLTDCREKSNERDAVICGIGSINGNKCCIFSMESKFMMGSMGAIVGEKIASLFEFAAQENLPVVGFTLSGGARMQEGIISLMQMAKTSGAVKLHSDNGGLYIAVLCDPTTGGVTASFAMEADIIIAEPGALIGFAGPRVIEQTIKQKLPEGFQRAELLLKKGFVDIIASRSEQKDLIGQILKLHNYNK